MGRINGFITKTAPSSPAPAASTFQNRFVQLDINASSAQAFSPAIPVPFGATNVTIQFFHNIANISGDPTTIAIEQSSDGVNFSEIYSPEAVPFVIGSGSTHTTINVIGVLSNWIRFRFNTIQGSYGVITACNLLFA
jgi:hypothetical protein